MPDLDALVSRISWFEEAFNAGISGLKLGVYFRKDEEDWRSTIFRTDLNACLVFLIRYESAN